MDELFAMLDAIRPLSGELKDHLTFILRADTIEKDDHLLFAGNVCRRVYFVVKGLFRCYYIGDDGEEICTWFMKENDVILSVGSFYSQKPGCECIQALEKSKALSIGHSQLDFIYDRYPEFNFHGRVMTQKYNILFDQEKYLLRLRKSPKEQYKFLLSAFPEIGKRVTKKDIASYLGVSRFGLSRKEPDEGV